MNWSDNIPPQGVLCDDDKGFLRVIKRKGEKLNEGCCITEDFKAIETHKLTPITPQEWWQFAPWNYDIDSAQECKIILLRAKNGYVAEGLKLSDGTFRLSVKKYHQCGTPIAWLPLP